MSVRAARAKARTPRARAVRAPDQTPAQRRGVAERDVGDVGARVVAPRLSAHRDAARAGTDEREQLVERPPTVTCSQPRLPAPAVSSVPAADPRPTVLGKPEHVHAGQVRERDRGLAAANAWPAGRPPAAPTNAALQRGRAHSLDGGGDPPPRAPAVHPRTPELDFRPAAASWGAFTPAR